MSSDNNDRSGTPAEPEQHPADAASKERQRAQAAADRRAAARDDAEGGAVRPATGPETSALSAYVAAFDSSAGTFPTESSATEPSPTEPSPTELPAPEPSTAEQSAAEARGDAEEVTGADEQTVAHPVSRPVTDAPDADAPYSDLPDSDASGFDQAAAPESAASEADQLVSDELVPDKSVSHESAPDETASAEYAAAEPAAAEPMPDESVPDEPIAAASAMNASIDSGRTSEVQTAASAPVPEASAQSTAAAEDAEPPRGPQSDSDADGDHPTASTTANDDDSAAPTDSRQSAEEPAHPEQNGDEHVDAAGPAPSSKRRRNVLRTSGRVAVRIVALAVTIVLCAALGWAYLKVPFSDAGSAKAATRVLPQSIDASLTCSGALRSGGSATTVDAGQSIGTADVAGASHAQASLIDLAGAGIGTSQTEHGNTVFSTSTTAPVTLRVSKPGKINATALQSAAGSGSLSGTALTGCQAPAFDSWVSAGSTVTGRNSTLVLVNSSAMDSTVTLQLYTSSGLATQQIAPIRVAANSQRAIPLTAYVPNLPAVMVHLKADGAPVTAVVQSDTTRVLQAGGVALTSAGAAPSTHQVIDGVSVSGSVAQNAVASNSDWSDAVPTLRVLSPSKATTIHVKFSGGPAAKEIKQTLLPGMATDIPLTSLGDGTYRIDISSSQPVVAAARSVRGATDNPDFDWLPAGTAVAHPSAIAVPASLQGASLLLSSAAASAKVTISGAENTTVTVPANGTTAVALTAGAAYEIASTQPLYMSVAAATDTSIAQTALKFPSDTNALDVFTTAIR